MMEYPVYGPSSFATYLEGSHTLFAVSTEGAEAEILAAEVYRELIQFGPIMRRELELHRFLVVSVGSLFEIEEAHETFAVPITVGYALEERWKLVPHAPFLKRIKLSEFVP
jgi:hypothetical protein